MVGGNINMNDLCSYHRDGHARTNHQNWPFALVLSGEVANPSLALFVTGTYLLYSTVFFCQLFFEKKWSILISLQSSSGFPATVIYPILLTQSQRLANVLALRASTINH